MRSAPRWLSLALTLLVGPSAWAQTAPQPAPPPATQPAPAPDQAPVIATPPPAPGTTPPITPLEPEEKPNPDEQGAVGVGVRARFIFLPSAILNLFLDHSTSLASYALGASFIRRKGNFDIEFAVEYDKLSLTNGYYLPKGDNPGVQGQYPDFIKFDNFGMISADATFIWHTNIVPTVQFRYGAGIGIGFLLGDLKSQKSMCSANTQTDDLDDPNTPQCTLIPGSEFNRSKPPVVPIVHLLVGIRFKLIDQISLNVEFGIRDIPFVGANVGYFF